MSTGRFGVIVLAVVLAFGGIAMALVATDGRSAGALDIDPIMLPGLEPRKEAGDDALTPADDPDEDGGGGDGGDTAGAVGDPQPRDGAVSAGDPASRDSVSRDLASRDPISRDASRSVNAPSDGPDTVVARPAPAPAPPPPAPPPPPPADDSLSGGGDT